MRGKNKYSENQSRSASGSSPPPSDPLLETHGGQTYLRIDLFLLKYAGVEAETWVASGKAWSPDWQSILNRQLDPYESDVAVTLIQAFAGRIATHAYMQIMPNTASLELQFVTPEDRSRFSAEYNRLMRNKKGVK